jgi:hypothetical protein
MRLRAAGPRGGQAHRPGCWVLWVSGCLGRKVTVRPARAADCARMRPICLPGLVVYNNVCGINPMGLPVK